MPLPSCNVTLKTNSSRRSRPRGENGGGGSGSGSGSGSSYTTTSSSSWGYSSSGAYDQTVGYDGFYTAAYYPGQHRDSLGTPPASGSTWPDRWYEPRNYTQASGYGSGSGSGSGGGSGPDVENRSESGGSTGGSGTLSGGGAGDLSGPGSPTAERGSAYDEAHRLLGKGAGGLASYFSADAWAMLAHWDVSSIGFQTSLCTTYHSGEMADSAKGGIFGMMDTLMTGAATTAMALTGNRPSIADSTRPTYGHDDAYRNGQIIGIMTGEAVIAVVGAVIDPNKLHHIFGDPAHNLAPLVQQLGSQTAAFQALENAATAAVKAQGINGLFEVIVQVCGMQVTIRGTVVNGVVRIGTAFIP